MNRITRYCSFAVMTVAGAGFVASCDNTKDNDEYTVYQGAVPSVYFKTQADQDIAIGDNDTQFTFNVYRDNKGAAETVNLAWTGDYTGFSVPTSVTFESGKDVATAAVTFNTSELQGNHTFEMTVSIPNTENSGFTQSSITFYALYTTWVSLGKAVYTDYWVGTFFGVENISYYVEVMEHPVTKGLYRVMNPYGEAYPYNDPGDYDDTEDHSMYVNASDPDKVFIADKNGNAAFFYTGMDWGYGEFIMTTFASYYLRSGNAAAAAPYFGTMEDGVIYLAESSTLCAMANYDGGGLYSNNFAGPAKWIVLP